MLSPRLQGNPQGALPEDQDDRTADVLTVKVLSFAECDNADCSDQRYGCKCISYEKCCGCIMQ